MESISMSRLVAALEAIDVNRLDGGNTVSPDFYWGADEGIRAAVAVVTDLLEDGRVIREEFSARLDPERGMIPDEDGDYEVEVFTYLPPTESAT